VRRAPLLLLFALAACRPLTGDIVCAADDNCPRQLPFCVEGTCVEAEAPPPPDGGDPPSPDGGDPPPPDGGDPPPPDGGDPPPDDAGPPLDAGVDAGPVDPCPGQLDHLVINELDYDQAGADDAEFVELYNPYCEALPLAGLRLVFINGSLAPPRDYATFALDSVAAEIPAGGFLVVADADVNVDGAALSGTLPADLENGAPDAVVLVDSAALIDGLAYGFGITADIDAAGLTVSLNGQGSAPVADDNLVEPLSLIRFPDGVDTDNSDRDFRGTRRPTPGAANDPAPLFADGTNGNCVDASGANAICANLAGGLAEQDAAVIGPPMILGASGGEVIDDRTGLRWDQDRPNLPGTAFSANLDCGAGRLPTRFELATILDYGAAEALPVSLFPEHPTQAERDSSTPIRLWTSSVDPEDATQRYVVRVPDGDVTLESEDLSFFALCVDDTDSIVEHRAEGFPSGDTLTDTRTGLEWDARDSQTGTFESALDSCASLVIGGRDDWRLPSMRELLSVAEEEPTSFFGSVWPLSFNDSTTAGQPFLSSTPVSGSADDRVWGVEFLDGTSRELDPTSTARFRCVAGPL
jgi:hypothetical protein